VTNGFVAILQLSLDGWKSWLVAMGAKLHNFIWLLPNGGAYFSKVVDSQGASVNHQYLEQIIEEEVKRVCKIVAEAQGKEGADVDWDAFLGVITDAEAVNVKAMQELEKAFPLAIMLTCQAHALSLLLKDICNSSTLYSTVVETSREVGNFFTRCAKARAILTRIQVSLGCNVLMSVITCAALVFQGISLLMLHQSLHPCNNVLATLQLHTGVLTHTCVFSTGREVRQIKYPTRVPRHTVCLHGLASGRHEGLGCCLESGGF
jgi:hypothetical protein